MRLSGKRALVTAAGQRQGIGRAIALAFAREGATVLATDSNEASLAALQDEARGVLRVRRLDVLDNEAIAMLAREYETSTHACNVICHCAGVVHAGSLAECRDGELELAWRLNVASMASVCLGSRKKT